MFELDILLSIVFAGGLGELTRELGIFIIAAV